MPSGTPSTTAAIAGSVRVHATALRADFDPDQPVHALNWFDSRWLWLYNLYNILAARSVWKVGGHPLFKARVTSTLHGSDADRRSVLLVVRYPGIAHFKAMLESRYFQLVSILRGLAVARFTFAFGTRTDSRHLEGVDDASRIPQGGVYAIHHYRLSDRVPDLDARAAEVAALHQVTLAFSSRVSARLYSQRGDDPPAAVETIMDGCMIMQAESRHQLERWAASDDFQALASTTGTSFVAVLDRIF